jgi:hypothetical protein
MYHTIEFATEVLADLETSPKEPLRRIRFRKSTRLKAQLKPYVAEGKRGPVEVADLFFDDGTVTRMVPFRYFSLID